MRPGELTTFEQMQLIARAAAAQAMSTPSMLRLRLGHYPTGTLALRKRPLPDTKLCSEALDHAKGSLSPAVLNHSLRCWIWADVFAQIDAIEYDPEDLFTACALHDVGLGAEGSAEHGCFTYISAADAEELTTRVGASERSIKRIGEAIRLHMDLTVDRDVGADAYLLHAAAHFDVAGRRAPEVPRAAVHAAIAEYPRTGFTDEFAQSMRREVELRRLSRAATLWRSGMAPPLRTNPLDWKSR
ncbi:phosphohydrolase [Rhodococcus sp. IEGM 1409]|uniref:HD domain-containing protein n=1 Tax=Rhodococcus sp. IEGM 1409 TaxID=3047082 RepID=UPI0024B81E16|nr:HD domain-containing protein [Rhodococcus sp. IEGM 1409]MDI9900863.1 phosphohydrolase [Rhodococcus sp. IEGM 1409]